MKKLIITNIIAITTMLFYEMRWTAFPSPPPPPHSSKRNTVDDVRYVNSFFCFCLAFQTTVRTMTYTEGKKKRE